MGGTKSPQSSRAAPWIQALCITAMVAVFYIDAIYSEIDAPAILYGGLVGIALGLSTDIFKSLTGK